MWDRSKIFLRKMGGIILMGSIVVWALSAFPLDTDFSKDYPAEIKRVRASYAAHQATAGKAETENLKRQEAAAVNRIRAAQHAEKAEKSYMGRLGKAVAPAFKPIGIDWRGGVALLTGFAAKEIVVSTLGVLHAVKEESEPDALKNALSASGMTPLSAFSMMIFVLLYLPCLATTSAIRRETGSYKWMFFSIVYSTSIAWCMSFLVYQGGKLLGFS